MANKYGRLTAVVRFGGPGSGPHPGSGRKEKTEPKSDGAAHTDDGKLPGYPHGTAASGTHAYTVTDTKGNEISHHDTLEEARSAARDGATAQNQNMLIRDNTGKDPHADSAEYWPAGQSPWDITTGAIQSGKVKAEQTQFEGLSTYDKAAYLNGTLTGEAASYSDTRTGEGTASGASMDDAEGDRGDVAEPAVHMPRSMSSRCMACGCDLSVRDIKHGGSHCQEHAEEFSSPPPHTAQRPGGGITAPRAPMTSEFSSANGPGAVGKLLAKVKTNRTTPKTTTPPRPTKEPSQV